MTVRSAKSALDDLHAEDIGSVQIDLRNGNDTRYTFAPSVIPVPPGLTIEQIDPPEIDLAWEDRSSRTCPIEVGIVGTPASGLRVEGDADVRRPATARVRNTKSEVMVTQHARADAFDVTGLAGGKYTRQLAIEQPPGESPTTRRASRPRWRSPGKKRSARSRGCRWRSWGGPWRTRSPRRSMFA